jgi:hypothetical protein
VIASPLSLLLTHLHHQFLLKQMVPLLLTQKPLLLQLPNSNRTI